MYCVHGTHERRHSSRSTWNGGRTLEAREQNAVRMAVSTCVLNHTVQLRSLTQGVLQERISLVRPAKSVRTLGDYSKVSSRISFLQKERRASTATVAAATAVTTLIASATFSMPADVFIGAARVTAVYATMFAALLLWQGVSKLRLAAACQAKKEPFDRWACNNSSSCLQNALKQQRGTLDQRSCWPAWPLQGHARAAADAL